MNSRELRELAVELADECELEATLTPAEIAAFMPLFHARALERSKCPAIVAAVAAELQRLGLDVLAEPDGAGLTVSGDGADEFIELPNAAAVLAELRTLAGITPARFWAWIKKTL